MNYTEAFENALVCFKETPEKAGVFDSPFWSLIIETLCDEIHKNGTLESILKENSLLINYGICKEVISDPGAMQKKIEDVPAKNCPFSLVSFSGWLTEQINKIRQCDKRDAFVKILRSNQILLSKYNREVQTLRKERNAKLNQLAESSQSPNASSDLNKVLSETATVDNSQLEVFRIKKAISRGVFFSVDQKRDNVQREANLAKAQEQIKTYLDIFPLCDTIVEIRQSCAGVSEILQKIVELELTLDKNQADIESIEKQQSELSVIELENKVREELEQIRDLTRLSAKRMHLDNCPILTEGKHFFTYKKIIECLNRILEFDPRILKNDRVPLFGKPQVVLVPGSGNSVYDWKNNIIIIPLVYTADNPMMSISNGMIEYRLDTDEDKTTLNSYNELPENKEVRSSIQLKSQLIKDYTVWMTSEYMGYRVLQKSVKDWFEHEIGPNRNEIFIPHDYQPFNFSASEFTRLYKSVEERINNAGIEKADNDDLWTGSILSYHQGNIQRSYDLLNNLVQRKITNPMIFYNFGQVSSKVFQRSSAIKGYTEFMNRLPQCWWTRVAGEHLRTLQSSCTA